MGSSTKNQTVTQKSEPPRYLGDALASTNAQMLSVYGTSGPRFFPDKTYVPMSATTNEGLAMAEKRAREGTPLTASGSGLLNATLRGDFLNSNPYMDANYANAMRGVRGAVDTKYAGNYRSNSGAEAAAFAGAAGSTAATMYGANYDAERARQQAAIGLIPAMASQDYEDSTRLAKLGATRESYDQAIVDDARERWDYNENLPYWKMDQLTGWLGAIQGGTGKNVSTNTPVTKNRTAGALGGAASGAAMGTAVYPGWGTLIGGVAGGIAGAVI